MRSTQRISPVAVSALDEALVDVFWKKLDLLSFLRAAVDDQRLLEGIDWLARDVPKRDSVRCFLDRVVQQGEVGRAVLLRLLSDVAALDDFPHLAWLDDAETRIERARASVARVRRHITPYETELARQAMARDRIERTRTDAAKKRATTERLLALRDRYLDLAQWEDAQARGLAFEPFLKDLFDLHDLHARAAFMTRGEQLDGAFALDSDHFIVEARWRRSPTTREHLNDFNEKTCRKGEKTLGLFVSVSGFEPGGVDYHCYRGSRLILMDGQDLLAVLEERLSLLDLLRRKVRHASETGEVFLPIGQFGALVA